MRPLWVIPPQQREAKQRRDVGVETHDALIIAHGRQLRQQCGFAIVEDRRGAVAQLGERLNGIEEVKGSTPFSSTTTPSVSVFNCPILCVRDAV